MSLTTRIFLGVMVLTGVVTGIVAMHFPDIAHGRFPSYSWPLLVAFMCELLMRPRIEAGVLPPLPMEMRFAGVIGAALLAYGLEYLLLGLAAAESATQ